MGYVNADSQPVSSFVVRFYEGDQGEKVEARWRIKVTHVQGESETSFRSMEDVMKYMKQVLGE